jgi:AcrR family transcriptional regulator
MDPERRREHLLDVASEYVAKHGTAVSLDDIAPVAGISPPLMRHYFKNRDGLLAALTDRATAQLERIWLGADSGDLADRLVQYVDWVPNNQWAHWLWVASAGNGAVPEFRPTRERLMGAAVSVPYKDQDAALRLRANAWVGAIEATVTEWLNDARLSRDEVINALLDLAVRLDIAGAKPAARRWRRRAA